VLVLTGLDLLSACKHQVARPDVCVVLPEIPKLTEEQQQGLFESNVPDDFIKAVGDYKEIRAGMCRD
jgi:hypothetical protein